VFAELARQQFAVLKRHHPDPKLDLFDKLFWLLVRRLWLPKNSICIHNQYDTIRLCHIVAWMDSASTEF